MTECIILLDDRLSFLDDEYSKQPTLRLKTKIGEVWSLLQELKKDG